MPRKIHVLKSRANDVWQTSSTGIESANATRLDDDARVARLFEPQRYKSIPASEIKERASRRKTPYH